MVLTAWPGKVREPGVQLTTDPSPVPLRLTLGLAEALLAIVTFPDWLPTEGGVKVTLTVQLAPAARLAPQLLFWAKGRLVAMLVFVTRRSSVLLKVRAWAELVVFTAWPGKVREPGVQLTADPSPVPLRLTLGFAEALLAIVT